MAIIDIIDLMAPGTINYEFVKMGSGISDDVSHHLAMRILNNFQNCFSNANYFFLFRPKMPNMPSPWHGNNGCDNNF